jgi:Ca-activated chloride channel family protein
MRPPLLLLSVLISSNLLIGCSKKPEMAASAEYAAASADSAMPTDAVAAPSSTARYQHNPENQIISTSNQAISTLSLDVDTGAYANVRRFIEQGQLPPTDAVRIEELLNYFPYSSPNSPDADMPFAVDTELGRAPWQPNHLLLKIGVKAMEVDQAHQPPANLVFLIDVSGSMDEPHKLPLAQASLRLLVNQLRPQDYVSLVVYAGRTAVELPSTSAKNKAEILAAINRLTASGSTDGESALRLAYDQAAAHHLEGGINRIVLMTDGDFNVGVTDTQQIIDMVSRARERGVSLSTFGFGTDNYQEVLMEQIADVGNGNYSYIDSLEEAHKVFDRELAATFNTVAKDVKLQLEFNPEHIQAWRLIGYENRVLAEHDFQNDQVDAAEVGAGKSVVALYELTPVGQASESAQQRYQHKTPATTPDTYRDELGFLKVRYKQPNGNHSIERSVPIAMRPTTQPSADFQFAAAVAGFGQLLKHSNYRGNWSYAQSAQLAAQARGADPRGYRQDFVKLVELAGTLAPSSATPE